MIEARGTTDVAAAGGGGGGGTSEICAAGTLDEAVP